jgi:MFS family permease
MLEIRGRLKHVILGVLCGIAGGAILGAVAAHVTFSVKDFEFTDPVTAVKIGSSIYAEYRAFGLTCGIPCGALLGVVVSAWYTSRDTRRWVWASLCVAITAMSISIWCYGDGRIQERFARYLGT